MCKSIIFECFSSIEPSEKLMYVLMEKGDSDLRRILQGYKTSLPLYTLMSYWHQMLLAVQHIHKKDVIHSDLKPENFLMVNGRLKLIDFGISSNMAVDATSIIKFSQVGTFNYISPETLMDTSTENSPSTNQPKIKVRISCWIKCILNAYDWLPYNSVLSKNSIPDISEVRRVVLRMYIVPAHLQEDTIQPYHKQLCKNASDHRSYQTNRVSRNAKILPKNAHRGKH